MQNDQSQYKDIPQEYQEQTNIDRIMKGYEPLEGEGFVSHLSDEVSFWGNLGAARQIANRLTCILLLVMGLAAPCLAYTDNQLADAIYKAENSVKYPYGVKSINTHGDKEYARKLCLNSIRNAKARWVKAGKPEDFITFMGRRYSPPKQNPNWIRLVKYFLKGTK